MLPNWTEDEKSQFLDTRRKYVAANMEKVVSAISKTFALLVQVTKFYRMQAPIDSHKGALEQDDQHVGILKDWMDNVKRDTEAVSSDPSLASDLAVAYQMMVENPKNVPYAEDELDFGACYEYLVDIMEGKKPRPLQTFELMYLSVFFEIMEKSMQEWGTEKEKEGLSNLTESNILQSPEKLKETAKCRCPSTSKASCVCCDSDINPSKVPADLLKSITE